MQGGGLVNEAHRGGGGGVGANEARGGGGVGANEARGGGIGAPLRRTGGGVLVHIQIRAYTRRCTYKPVHTQGATHTAVHPKGGL